ncbi:MAG: nucleoside recognition domain-containing protein, partial [Myxococcota bacterium]|nr:nucleoside recognition domain-containing protein [Myxococcota bacterium]
MNQVFLIIIVLSVGTAAFTGTMEEVSMAAMASAKGAVELAIGLIGYMALFLGLLQVAHVGGLLKLLARAIRPLMVRLFPDVPEDHPAMGAIIMNISANMLGLGNAATPLGIKAMQELDKLNPHKGTATNAMALFLTINTSGVALLPSGVVSVRAQEGSLDPWGIVAPSLIATGISTIVAIMAARLYCRLPFFSAPDTSLDENTEPIEPTETTEIEEPVSRRAVMLLSVF